MAAWRRLDSETPAFVVFVALVAELRARQTTDSFDRGNVY